MRLAFTDEVRTWPRRVILDTGVIAFERGKLDVDTVLGADDAAMAAITAMELLVGVERADEAHKQRRASHLDAILSSVVDYTRPSGRWAPKGDRLVVIWWIDSAILHQKRHAPSSVEFPKLAIIVRRVLHAETSVAGGGSVAADAERSVTRA
jgi:hypothetical protein